MRVVIADDQDIMRQGLSMILKRDKQIEVVGLAENGQDAVNLCRQLEVDVVLMDMRMPVMDGVEATKRIKEERPDIKVLVLTTFKDDEYIFGSLKNGASGYLLKDASPESIISGLHSVYDGGTLMNPDVATKLISQATLQKETVQDPEIKSLTERELEICHFLGEGLNNKEIGDELFISEGTVKNNITKILDKLSLRDRTQLALFAVKNQL